MSAAEQEELISEQDAALYLDVSPERLRLLAVQGELRLILMNGPNGQASMYLKGQVQRLKEALREDESKVDTEEWPDVVE